MQANKVTQQQSTYGSCLTWMFIGILLGCIPVASILTLYLKTNCKYKNRIPYVLSE